VAGVLPYVRLSASGELPERTVFAVSGGSASLSDFILPATDHFLWGTWISEHFSRDSWIEGSLYLGGLAVALSLAAVLSLYRSGGSSSRLVTLLVLLGFTSGIIALGTHLHWNESAVELRLPQILTGMLERDVISIRLPGFYFFKFVPFYDRMRTFKRAAALVLLPVSVLAGLGFDSFRERIQGSRMMLVSALLFLFLFLEIYPGPFRQWERVEPRPIDVWLRAQEGSGAVVVFPFHLQEDQRQVYATLHHGKPFVGGFFSAFPPGNYVELEAEMEGFPSSQTLGTLGSLGVEYILLSEAHYTSAQLNELEPQLLMNDYGGEFGDMKAYRIPSAP
jgi:hypothetical protein